MANRYINETGLKHIWSKCVNFFAPKSALNNKADLVDGKVPTEQLPDDIDEGVTSWNDLKDKPFGESKAFEDVVWNGNAEGLVSSNTLSVGGEVLYTFYKVSDDIITLNQICGCKGMQSVQGFNEDGEAITKDLEIYFGESADDYDSVIENMVVSDSGSWLDEYNSVTIAVCAEAGDGIYIEDIDFTFTFPEAGLYFSRIQAQSEMGEEIIYTSLLQSSSQIKQIDSKFIPDTFVKQSDKGQPNGVASLDNTGKIPESQIPDELKNNSGNTGEVVQEIFYADFNVNLANFTITSSTSTYQEIVSQIQDGKYIIGRGTYAAVSSPINVGYFPLSAYVPEENLLLFSGFIQSVINNQAVVLSITVEVYPTTTPRIRARIVSTTNIN